MTARTAPGMAILVAAILIMACGGSAVQPTPTAEPSGGQFVTATPEPTPTPLPPNTLLVRKYPAGSEVTDVRTGVLFMDTATGELETVSLLRGSQIYARYMVSPDNRFVYAEDCQDSGEAFLLDRTRGTVWAQDDLPGRPISGNLGLLTLQGHLLFQTEVPGEIGVYDSSLNEVWRIDTGSPSTNSFVPFWPLTSGERAVFLRGPAYFVIDLARRSVSTLPVVVNESSGIRDVQPEVLVLDDGFAIVEFPRLEDFSESFECTASIYGWPDELRSTATFEPCRNSSFGSTLSVSPDGRQATAWAPVTAREPFAAATYPQLSAVHVFDTATGETLFRVMGALLPSRPAVIPHTPWLADSSALVVQTRDGNVLVAADGSWISEEIPSGLLIPAPQNAALIALAGSGAVWNRDTVKLVHPGIEARLAQTYSWGIDDAEARYIMQPVGRPTRHFPIPAVAAAIQFPPFDDDFLSVAGENGCISVYELAAFGQPVAECVASGTPLTPLPVPRLRVGRPPDPSSLTVVQRVVFQCTDPGLGLCTWVSVETPTGVTGWIPSVFLRWPGIAPPESN